MRFHSGTWQVENLQLGIVMNNGSTAIALRGAAAMFVLMVGCGAAVGAQPSAPTSGTPDSGGRTGGGALPVVPARLAPLPEPGGCIIGLDCGCIRGLTCPGTIPHHKPAPTNGHLQDDAPPPAAP